MEQDTYTERPADRLSRLIDEVEAETAPTSPAEPIGPPPGPIGDSPSGAPHVPPGGLAPLLGGLAGNPAIMAALPSLLENLGPLLGSMGGARPGSTGEGSTPGAAAAESAPASFGGGGETPPLPAAAIVSRHTVDRHTALLCAVKPYLSDERQAAAETVIRLCRVWDALEKSGVSLSGILNSLGGNSGTNQR